MNVLNKIKIYHNIFIKHNLFFRSKKYSIEDNILKKIFKYDKKGFYIDVGCNHPVHNNNTFELFKKGWQGINIDVNKFSIDLFNFLRPKDINVNSLVYNKKKLITLYYQKKFSALNTINKKIANRHFNFQYKSKQIKSTTLNSILKSSRFKNKPIDFLNIDVEGAELNVLKSLNFKIYKPKVICVEILLLHNYRNNKNKKKLFYKNNVVRFLIKKKYKKIWTCKYYRNHIFIKI